MATVPTPHNLRLLERYKIRVKQAREARIADLKVLLVVSGDLLFDDDLGGLVDHHLVTAAEMTFATRRVSRASRFGVLEVDGDGRVTRAREKPLVPDDEEHVVSAGIYCLSPRAVAAIPASTTFDFAEHLTPLLMRQGARVQTHGLRGYWSDVGTPAALREANLAALRGLLATGKSGGHVINNSGGRTYVSDRATVGEDVTFRGHNALLGPVRIGAGVTVNPAGGSTLV